MKQETLKKIVELADGFEWRTQESKSTSTKDGTNKEWIDNFIDFRMHGILLIETDDITIWQHYPLLLRRAVEGVNSAGKYEIYVYTNYVLLDLHAPFAQEDKDWEYSDYTKTDYLTPQEQAIEACLIELLERK